MWQEGHTYHEIAMALHCSRNVVAGHVYRHRAGMGTAPPPRPPRPAPVRRGWRGRTKGSNKATDPATRELVDRINASRVFDYRIAEIAGVHRNTIARWRKGRKGRTFELECVREALTATER